MHLRPGQMSTEQQELTERAMAAVKAFRAMQHQLSSYARALTGNKKTRVEIASGVPRTDGTVIYYQPPIALGDRTPHDRFMCSKRGDDGLQACTACRVREEVLVNIYHEISHIVEQTFAPTSDRAKKEALDLAVKEWGGEFEKQIKARMQQKGITTSYLGLANIISPYLPSLVNTLEDARVDTAMFNRRKGTRKMMVADTFNMLKNGIPNANFELQMWNEAPLNSQLTIGVYLEAAIYPDWQQYFHPEVGTVIADARLQKIIEEVRLATSAERTYELSFQVLARLRELGYFKMPEEEKKDEQCDPSDEGEGETEPEDEGEVDADGVPEEPREDRRSEEKGGDAESDSGAGSASEEPDSEGSDQGNSDRPDASGDAGAADEDDSDGDGRSDQPEVGGVGEGDGDDAEQHDAGDESGDGEPDNDGGQPGERSGDGGSQAQPVPGDRPSGEPDVNEESGSDPEHDASEGPESESSGSDLIDSGADQGMGGIDLTQMPMGTPEDVEAAAGHLHNQIEQKTDDLVGGMDEKQAVATAVIQGTYFETPSTGVKEVQEHNYRIGETGWRSGYRSDRDEQLGYVCDMDIPESVLGPALLKTRRAFDANQASAYNSNMRRGHVNTKVLGKRAWSGDDRLFGKKRTPEAKDYAVKIMVDISTSNNGSNLALVKRSVFAQAELLHRVGIRFSVTAHSASQGGGGFIMHLHQIKTWDEPWNEQAKEAVRNLATNGGNVDGHAMEYGRKELMKVDATDKILLYYTDGKFPAANKEEELEVLLRQLHLCKRDRITLLGVGIRTDSPVRHGLDTVQVDGDEDLKRVVEHLGKRLQWSAR